MIKRPFYRQVWFWLLMVGILVLVAGLLIIWVTDGNGVLGSIVIALGALATIAGLIYWGVNSKSEIDFNRLESGIEAENVALDQLTETGRKFNKTVGKGYMDYIKSDKFKEKLQRNLSSQGRLAQSFIGAAG